MRFALLAALACAPRATPEAAPAAEPEVPLFEGLGAHHRPADTDDPLAQRYFDQGVVLAFGFNHAEAERSFRRAAALDPECGMCWWGVAWVLGPNINAPMDPAAVPVALDAVRRAQQLSADASPADRALVAAVAARYGPDGARDADFREAMAQAVARHPDDLDLRSIYADALLIEHPWDYWTADGAPRPWTPEILDQLERVLADDPDHVYGNHLYIHAVEASARPERGLEAAERLATLAPGAGHLVHMPGHIYLRIGRYHDVTRANLDALAADARYMAHDHAGGMYAMAYHPHNAHFLWMGAMMEGREALATRAAGMVRAHVDPEQMRSAGWTTLQHYWAAPIFNGVRFGRWDELLDAPLPPDDLPYLRALAHWGRGTAHAARGETSQAAAELAAFRAVEPDPRIDEVTIWDINDGRAMVDIAGALLSGEIAASRGDWTAAVGHFERAVAREDTTRYDEPPSWPLPTRHALGAAYLAAGRPADAERAWREDLLRFPNDGWALVGLAEVLDGLAAANARRDAAVTFAFAERPPTRAWASVPPRQPDI